MDNMRDAHYFLLPSQGNVYALSKICLKNGENKILFASLRKKIYLLEYYVEEGILKPLVRDILFSYIPNGAEVISIDAFNRSNECDDVFIGITIIKLNSDFNNEMYLNIYSEQEVDANTIFNIDSVAQNCLSINLNFTPYQLFHTYLVKFSEDNKVFRETVWILSGSDVKVHIYKEDQLNHSYVEIEAEKHFPELKSPPSIVLWIDILHKDDYKTRITAYGCECGIVILAVINTLNNTIQSLYYNRFEGLISQLRLFNLNEQLGFPAFITDILDNADLEEKITPQVCSSSTDINLAVSSSLQMSAIFMNVLENGLSNKYDLVNSDNYDACLCVCPADIDMDGDKEIIVGTYNKELLLYKYVEDKWSLVMQRSLEDPIHSLHYFDVTGDGVKELLVLTLRGLHVLQHSQDKVHEKFIDRIKRIIDISSDIKCQKEIIALGASFDL